MRNSNYTRILTRSPFSLFVRHAIQLAFMQLDVFACEMNPPNPMLYVGFLLAVLGAGMVLYYKPS